MNIIWTFDLSCMGPKSSDGIGADLGPKSAPNLFFPSFFIFEDLTQSLDQADDKHPISHLGPKNLSRTGDRSIT